ncbi:MAG: hypothetical protein MI866_21545 [Bacteroidales bacterium]|nr:hypothetical protein [Bacteroidales bacterium]
MIDFYKVMKLSGYPIDKAQKAYNEIKLLANRETTRERTRWEIFNYHADNNEFYFNQILKGNKNLDWDQIPILSKYELNGDYKSKLPGRIRKKKLYVGYTAGSSGAPIAIARDAMHHAMVWLNVENYYTKSGISIKDRQARFYATPLSGFEYRKERLKDFLANRYRFIVSQMTDEVIDKWLLKFKHSKFKYIYGYSRTLYFFAKFIAKRDIVLKDICPSLKICIVTSEICTPNEEAYISKVLGVPVANEYGASEIGIIGYKTDKHWECSNELLYLEIVDNEGNVLPSGSTGRLLCTCLYNIATPLIRYEIGDNVTLEKINGQTRITSIDGRILDNALLPSGKIVPGITFYYLSEELVHLIGSHDYRVVQCKRNKFYVEIVECNELPCKENDRLRKVFDKYLEPGLDVSYKCVDEIEKGSNGKYKVFVSLV